MTLPDPPGLGNRRPRSSRLRSGQSGRNDRNEECEGTNLNDASCATLGFYQGTLRCTGACLFDTSECSGQCGDGVIQETFSEICDGLNLDGQTCGTLGYASGNLACLATCQWDVK